MVSSKITVRREAASGEQLHGKQTLSSWGVRYKLGVAATAGAIPAAAAVGYTISGLSEAGGARLLSSSRKAGGGIGVVSAVTRPRGRTGDRF